MPQIVKSKKLPFSCAQMFDLVADVERYPEFLPWCAKAERLKYDAQEIVGRLVLAKGALRYAFTTRNPYVYGKFMDIELLDGPFKRLKGRWEFEDLPEGGCLVRHRLSFELPFLLAPLLSGVVEHMANTMVEAFALRASAIYGEA